MAPFKEARQSTPNELNVVKGKAETNFQKNGRLIADLIT
jgi:hypothetical protein